MACFGGLISTLFIGCLDRYFVLFQGVRTAQLRPFLRPRRRASSSTTEVDAVQATENELRAQLRRQDQLTLEQSEGRSKMDQEGRMDKHLQRPDPLRLGAWITSVPSAPNIAIRASWLFLNSDLTDVLNAPLPGASAPTIGEAQGCWWPIPSIFLPVPGPVCLRFSRVFLMF